MDDVFLLLDAQKNRADYVSPNIERLLGLTMKSVRKNIGTLALLYPADFPGRTKNHLEGLACGDQREWDTELSIRNRGASLVPCGCHGQRGRGPNQAHSGSV